MTADAMRDYLEAISRYPLLTTQQEIQLARKIAQYMELRDNTSPTPAEQRLIKAGLKARATMVNCNLRLVVHIAKRYTGRIKSMDMLDLCQEGNIGLQRAAEKFDASRGYKFSTYAYWWIRQSLKRAIDSKERMIKIPIHMIDRTFKALQIETEYMKEHGRKPSKTELAQVMGLTIEQLLALVDCNSAHISLDELITDDGNSLLDLIASPEVDIDFDLDHSKEHVQLALSYLTDMEQDIINKRYNEDLTFTAIAKEHNVCRERIRQKITRTHRRLKQLMSESHVSTTGALIVEDIK
jgi:RNA polymerase sigma factor (sigma-70 family)